MKERKVSLGSYPVPASLYGKILTGSLVKNDK